MSITDELRKWVTDHYSGWKSKQAEGIAIADRIDAEHEKAIHELNVLAETSVPLPKDADDVPWNVGDRDEDDNEVIALKLAPDGWYVIAVGEWPYRPESKRHHHAPTVEDVLREFTDEVWNRCCEGATASDSGIDELVAECAARLRLAGEDE